MKTGTIATIAIGTAIALGALFRGSGPSPVEASADDATADELRLRRVERGKYIVSTAGCHDCHTPMKMGSKGPEPDMTRALSGHPEYLKLPPAPPPAGPWNVAVAETMTAWSGPWGTTFTANLTPDRETGTGTWSQESFVQTIRTGRHLGVGRPILPPMPIPVYRNLSDEDLEAVYWYLQSIPAVKNRVPQPLPPRPAQ